MPVGKVAVGKRARLFELTGLDKAFGGAEQLSDLHDLAECHDVVGQVGDLRHLRRRGTPGIVGGCLPNFHL